VAGECGTACGGASCGAAQQRGEGEVWRRRRSVLIVRERPD
jgi:hypothetical protein